MKRVNSLLLAATVGLTCLVQAERANAWTEIANPYGNTGVTVAVGMVGGYPHAVTKNTSTNECNTRLLGTASGLDDDYYFKGGEGNDTVILSDAQYVYLCGQLVYPLVYNGHAFDVHGEGGNDWLEVGSGRTSLVGGPGNDYLSGGYYAGWFFGGDGDDRIFSWGSGSYEWLDGGAGNDCLTDMNVAASYGFDCGAGDDRATRRWGYTPANMTNCESVIDYLCGGIS